MNLYFESGIGLSVIIASVFIRKIERCDTGNERLFSVQLES